MIHVWPYTSNSQFCNISEINSISSLCCLSSSLTERPFILQTNTFSKSTAVEKDRSKDLWFHLASVYYLNKRPISLRCTNNSPFIQGWKASNTEDQKSNTQKVEWENTMLTRLKSLSFCHQALFTLGTKLHPVSVHYLYTHYKNKHETPHFRTGSDLYDLRVF